MSTQLKYLATCDTKVTPLAATRSKSFTARAAIDPSGGLGSFYDASWDRVLSIPPLCFNSQSIKATRPPKCSQKICQANEDITLLQYLNYHREQQLSIALGLTQAKGLDAVINYTQPIDEYTRIISYNYNSRTDYISDDELKTPYKNTLPVSDAYGNHVIVFINWGIDAMIVLQLPRNDRLVKVIDFILEKVCTALSGRRRRPTLPENDLVCLKNIVHTQVFSNVADLLKISSIVEFYQVISRFKSNTSLHKPCIYNLCPIDNLRPRNPLNENTFQRLQDDVISKVEHYLSQFAPEYMRLKLIIERNYQILATNSDSIFNEIRSKWSLLNEIYEGVMQRLRTRIITVRRGEIDPHLIYESLDTHKSIQLKKIINELNICVNEMQSKIQFNNPSDDFSIQNDGLTFMNQEDLLKDWGPDGMTSSEYYSSESSKTNQLSNSTENTKEMDLKTMKSIIPTIDCINILLLGESGVGKSTFINAFVNYLRFNTLADAQTHKPVVLIPVSFLMTIDDDFKERLITFGIQDDMDNEDHHNPGQSVTQRCKSYVFPLRDSENKIVKKLRIIDTPGFGDTQGISQDDLNMQHILSYINNLTHLNAVCILLQPNSTQLHTYLRSCFIQLFSLLGENICEKIIFGFTNARSTFYTPGNTAPLLKNLLQSLPLKSIPFTKGNTFCFDSESFRYLVAKQNGITFTSNEETEYDMSWNVSCKESNRFLSYIHTNLTEPIYPSQWKSLKHAQLKIHLLIRPILETMRNLLRNISLWNCGLKKNIIDIYPKMIKTCAIICLDCPSDSYQVGHVWIPADCLHFVQNQCRTCRCLRNKHVTINYELDFKLRKRRESDSNDDMTKTVDDLCDLSVELSYICFGTVTSAEKDLFMVGFDRMIREEQYICQKRQPCQLNEYLLKLLNGLKDRYKDTREKSSIHYNDLSVKDIYGKIEGITKHPTIKHQKDIAEQSERSLMEFYEHKVLDEEIQ